MNVSSTSPHSSHRLADHDRLERSPATTGQKLNSVIKISDREQMKRVEELNKQKQALIDRRSQYMSNALKNGVSPEVVKLELASIDEKIQQIETKIREQSIEQQRKAQGLDEENKKKKETETYTKTEDPDKQTPEEQQKAYSTYIMNSVVSAKNELKQSGSVRMAQLTLRTEAKSWEYSDPAKSASLFRKALNLDGKIVDIAKTTQDQMTETIQSAHPPVIQKESPADLEDKQDERDKQDRTTEDSASQSGIEPYIEMIKKPVIPGKHIDEIV
ncbi:hypothetical protein D3C81_1141050 [compost metagenome]